MALFGRRPTLPTTTYGYTPPPQATAHGWTCPNDDCGVSDWEDVRRWPKPCPRCGSATNPQFDEPWAHEAEPLRLQWEIQRRPGAGGYYESQLLIWHYKDALQRADDQAAAGAQRVVRDYIERGMTPLPGNLHFQIVWEALEYGRLDDAADELTYWAAHVQTNNVDDDNNQRTNARQLLASQQRFLKHPASRQHWATPNIKQAGRPLASAIRNVLTANHMDDLHLLD